MGYDSVFSSFALFQFLTGYRDKKRLCCQLQDFCTIVEFGCMKVIFYAPGKFTSIWYFYLFCFQIQVVYACAPPEICSRILIFSWQWEPKLVENEI